MAITWRVPTDADWKNLEGSVDSTYGVGNAEWDKFYAWRGDDAGSKLANFTSGGNNSSGFSALAGGYRNTDGSFGYLGTSALFWSSSPSSGLALFRLLLSSEARVLRNAYDQAYGFSIRLCRNLLSFEEDYDDGDSVDAYEGNDTKTYSAIKIGDLAWTTESLKETKYADNSDISRITVSATWAADTTGARCEYNNDADDESDTYGYLYNWHAVNNASGLANDYEVPNHTGWKSPGTVVSDDSVGTEAWSNPENAKTQNDTYAVAKTNEGSGGGG
jgi:uncharacterized protein (TIGR02145 family)